MKLAYLQSSRSVEALLGIVSVTHQREMKFISRFELLFKPKFNNTEMKNSALSIPRTFSCALDTFLEKDRVCFCHIYQI